MFARKKMEREVRFMPPKGGIPAILVACLMQAVKGLFGVPEPLRTCLLECIAVAIKYGFERVPASLCILARRSRSQFVSVWVVHANDSITTVNDGFVYKRARDQLYRRFRMQRTRRHRVYCLKAN